MAETAETHPAAKESSIPKSLDENLSRSKVPVFNGVQAFPSEFSMMPITYPALVPGLMPMQNQEQTNHGAGLYAVPVLPFMGGPMAGTPSNTLIPLTYNIPTRSNPVDGVTVGGEQEQGQGQGRQQQAAPPREVAVRRFQFAFQLDLFLILKLAAVVFLFNQDGSRQRLVLLLLLASFVYLYQAGVLAPLIRWLSQGMQRAAAPPRPRPAVRADNVVGPVVPEDENVPRPEGEPGVENENQPPNTADHQLVGNENQPEPGEGDAVNWWRIAKEIQIIVIGFITSLLPGFHNVDN